MIRRSILFTVICLILHFLFIKAVKPHWKWKATQHQWQENIVKAQKFIYGESFSKRKVIVGSSLSNRLVMDSLEDFCNLSFNAKSIFEGLALIKKSSQPVQSVYIEMNMVLGGSDPSFSSSIVDPVPFYIKKYFFYLREENQPVGYVGELASYKIVKPVFRRMKSLFGNNHGKNTSQQSPLFNKMLKNHAFEFNEKPSEEKLDQVFNLLKKEITYFAEKNIQVAFFEMPVNKSICNSMRAVAVRESFYKYFPPQKYNYIDMPDCSAFLTTDGIHLSDTEAAIYTSYFKSSLKGDSTLHHPFQIVR